MANPKPWRTPRSQEAATPAFGGTVAHPELVVRAGSNGSPGPVGTPDASLAAANPANQSRPESPFRGATMGKNIVLRSSVYAALVLATSASTYPARLSAEAEAGKHTSQILHVKPIREATTREDQKHKETRNDPVEGRCLGIACQLFQCHHHLCRQRRPLPLLSLTQIHQASHPSDPGAGRTLESIRKAQDVMRESQSSQETMQEGWGGATTLHLRTKPEN